MTSRVAVVTGGAGFIGSHFLEYALKNSLFSEIRILDKLTYASNSDFLDSTLKNYNIEFQEGDICNATLVEKLTNKVDIIINFAAEINSSIYPDVNNVFALGSSTNYWDNAYIYTLTINQQVTLASTTLNSIDPGNFTFTANDISLPIKNVTIQDSTRIVTQYYEKVNLF